MSPQEQAKAAYNCVTSLWCWHYKTASVLLRDTTRPVVTLKFKPQVQQYTGTFPLTKFAEYKDLFVQLQQSTRGMRRLRVKSTVLISTYHVENTATGSVWPGSTEDFYARWGKHLNLLMLGKHTNIVMQDEFNEHPDAFTITLHEVFKNTDHLIDAEEGLIHKFDRARIKSYVVGWKRLNGWTPSDNKGLGRAALKPRTRRAPQGVKRWFDGTGVFK